MFSTHAQTHTTLELRTISDLDNTKVSSFGFANIKLCFIKYVTNGMVINIDCFVYDLNLALIPAY